MLIANFKYCLAFDLTNPKNLPNETQTKVAEQKKQQQKDDEAESTQIISQSENSDNAAKEYLDNLKKCVQKNDYTWIAAHFKYPVCVEINCREVKVNNPRELLKYKDQIFTDFIKKGITDQNRDELFEKYDLYMIGDGEIWFEPFGNIQNITNFYTGYSVNECSGIEPEPLPQKYYGAWEVYRIQEVGGSMSDSIVKASVGKKLYINKNSFVNETNLMEPSMENVEWITTEEDYFLDESGSKATLSWYDVPEAFHNKTINVYACSGGQKHLYLEITRQDELGFYFDGRLIFLKKVK
jgi:hypothetical protein